MSSNLNFNANDVPPNARPDPIPVGDYHVAIVASDVKPTSTGKGQMLKLELVVLDGEHKGRKVFDNLNIQHESAEAQKIAQGQLSAICHATGVMQLRNSAQLHNIPMLVRVGIKQSAGYDPQNVVKAYKPVAGGPPAANQTAPATAPAPSPNAPAWARKAG